MTNSILTEQPGDQSVLTGYRSPAAVFAGAFDEIDRQSRAELEEWYTRRARELAADVRAFCAEQVRLHRAVRS